MKPLILAFLSKRGCIYFALLTVLLLFSQNSYAQPDTIKYTGNPGFCPGGNKILTADPAPAGATYQWQLNNGPVTTSASYTVSTAGTVTVKVNGVLYQSLVISAYSSPSANFTFTPPTAQCASVPVSFTNTSTGTGLSYLWNFGDLNSGSNNTSTAANPIHKFIGNPGNGTQNFNVTLTVTSSEGCINTRQQLVSIKQSPSTQLGGDGYLIYTDGFPYFTQCTSTASLFTFTNQAASFSTNTAYKIIWGDGSPDYIVASFTTITHTYNVGIYSLQFIVNGSNGCSDTGNYKVFVGSNPAVGLGTPGNTNICTNSQLTFPITGTILNPVGTLYTVSFNDPNNVFNFQHPVPDSINHIFLINSCGYSSPGSNGANSFYAKIVATNPCGVSEGTVLPIHVSQKPTAAITILPKDTVCVNNPVTLTSSSSAITNVSTTGVCSTGKIVWQISPTTGWSVTSGSLGNDFNSNNLSGWISGSATPVINFNTPGSYTIKLKVGGNPLCGLDSITKTICVNPAPIGNFTLDTVIGCAPLTVTTTNTSNSPVCGTNTYNWTVAYAPTTGCLPNTIGFTYVGGTSATSANPQFQFTNPGVYTISLVTKSSNGACTAPTVSKVVTVKSKPVVTISAAANICENGTITPTAASSCYINSATTYLWTFTGGNPATSSLANPGTITYAIPGSYTIDVTVTNECGTTLATKPLTVFQKPIITPTPDDTVCRGTTVGPFPFSSNVTGTTYTWTNNNTAIGLGASGSGNIPGFVASNGTANPITGTIIVTPLNGCAGTPDTFTITVYPLPPAPTVITPVSYCQNATAVPLTATPLANHTLNWYSVSTGGTASSTAPTPFTTTTGSTNYYVSQTNAGGCEGPRTTSVVTINASPVLATAVPTNPTGCATPTGFITLTGLSPNTTYTVTYTKNGVPVTVNLTSNVSGNIVITGLTSGTYDNIKVTRLGCLSNILGPVSLVDPTPPLTPTAGSNGPVCSGGTLSLTANATTGATYNWSGPGFTSNQQNPTIVNVTTAASGNYSVTITVSGCTSGAGTVAVIINPTPANVTATTNAPLCSGDTLKLFSSSTITGAVTYAWTGPNGFISNNQNATIPNATAAASGTYSVVATLGNCSAAPKTVNVTVRPTPIIADSSFTNPSSCISSTGSISLMGLANSTSYSVNYLKNGLPVTTILSSNTAGTLTLMNLTAGTYSNITVTLNTCVSNSVGPFVLVAPNPPATPTATSNSPVCAGNPLTLTATTTTTGTITYNWTGPNGFTSNFQNPVITSATLAASGNYTVTATINGCTSPSATVTVIVSPNASVANAGPDQQLCNSLATLLAGNNAGSGTGTWTVVAPSTAVVSQINNPTSTISNLPTGITKVAWTVTNNVCQPTSDTVIITNFPALINAVSPLNNTICSGQNITVIGSVPTGGSGFYTFQWQQSTNNITFSNIVGATSISLTVSPTATTYYRRNTISGACAGSSDTAMVTVLAGITGNNISANQTICINTVPLILNGGLPAGGGGSFIYGWEQSTDNGVNWTTISSATGQNYQPGILNVTTQFRRSVNTALCNGSQGITSNVIVITINPDARAVFNPTAAIGCVPFRITADTINLTPFNNANSQYQWYVNGNLYSTSQVFPTYTMTVPGDSITIKLVAISRFGCKNDSVQHGFKTVLPPTPAFTQSDSVGCGPITVSFTNQTANAAQYVYSWIFGNGQTSALQQPAAVTFQTNPQGGDTVYTVRFITISPCKKDTLLRYVRVKSKPKALFTPDRTTGCSSYNFTFTNTSRSSGTTSYVWDFGDGSPLLPSNAAQVNHVYTVGNTTTFRVKLKATNECGTDSLVYNLVVTPITIRPDFAINGNERFGCLPHTVRFINNSQGGSLYSLNFGDGSPTVSGFGNTDTITHTYTTAGNFTATLRAVNNCSDTSDIELITVQLKPSVSFTATPLIACTGDTIRFNNVSDTGISYNWRFGDGGTSLIRNPTHVYSTGNTFRVWLRGTKTYTGGSCADSAFKDILVRDTLPGSFTAGTLSATCTPASISFVNDNRPAASTTWAFGDGTTGTGDSVNHTYTQAGTYVVKMISKGIAGCTYSSTRTITVTGLSGTLQYNSGYLCPGIPLRMEVISPNAPQIRYVFGNGDSLITTNTIINYTYPQPGIYIPYAYIISSNCTLRLTRGDTVRVERLRTGFRTQLQQNCGITTVTFTDTSNAFFGIRNWNWNFGDGTISQAQNPVHTYTQNGTYNVRLRITGNSNCVDTITIPLTITIHNYPVSTIGGDTVACIGQPLALAAIVQSADPIASYNWDFGNGTNGTGQTINAVYNVAGPYIIRLISRTSFGCADTVTKMVRANTSPIVNAGPDVTICRNQSIPIGATGATTWQWSPLQGLSCTTCANPIASPLFTTNYIVTGSNGTLCKANDTIQVRVIQPFNMVVSPTTILCIGDSVQLFATGAYTYNWNPAGSLSNPNISNPTAKPTTTTLYQVVGKDNFNCFTDTDYVRVNVGQYPLVDAGTGATVVAGTAITLNPIITNGPITRYRWTPPTDLSCTNCPRPIATINNNISYKLEAENAFGCIGSDTINFRVNCDPNQLYIPNAFSPDGDGTNDVLMVRGKGISAVKYFRVFNRWGQMVFERSNINVNDPQQGWNGNINGVPAQPDVYIYTAEAVCSAGGTFVYKGNVTLVR